MDRRICRECDAVLYTIRKSQRNYISGTERIRVGNLAYAFCQRTLAANTSDISVLMLTSKLLINTILQRRMWRYNA